MRFFNPNVRMPALVAEIAIFVSLVSSGCGDETCGALRSDVFELSLIGFPNPLGTGPDECGDVLLTFNQGSQQLRVEPCTGWTSEFGRTDLQSLDSTWSCEGQICTYRMEADYATDSPPSEVVFRYERPSQILERAFVVESLPLEPYAGCATNRSYRLGLTVSLTSLESPE